MVNKLVEYFLPPGHEKHYGQHERGKVSVIVNFAGIIYGVLSGIIYYFADFTPGVYIMEGLIASLIIALFLFRSGISKFTNGNFISACLIILISLFCFYSGGITSPGIFFFALVPMLSLIMVGNKNGIAWCGIVTAAIFSFYFFDMMGINFLKLHNSAIEKYIYISTSIGFIYILFFIIDIAQQSEKKANQLLERKNRQLDQSYSELKNAQVMLVQSEKMSSLGQLTAGIAHEINNPINFVSANITPLKRDIDEIMKLVIKYSELDDANFRNKLHEITEIKNQIDLNYTLEEIKSLLNGIEEGSKRTAEIVKGLRNFSRLDEEDMKMSNINEGIISTLVLLKNKLKQNNIEVINSFDNFSEIECYPGQLNQVFMNILSNAIDAVSDPAFKGERKIFISTLKENDPEKYEGSQIKISISDTGKGMSKEVRKKIFDPFFTTKDVGKGTGLGLSISYGIIEKHNGTIVVNSAEEKGTEFIITLPISKKNK